MMNEQKFFMEGTALPLKNLVWGNVGGRGQKSLEGHRIESASGHTALAI